MAGRYAAVYLFNTELWGGESWTRDLRYGTRDNRRVVDPPRYFQPLSIVNHRMRSDLGASRMDESASGADLVGARGTQGTCCGISGYTPPCLCSFFVYFTPSWPRLHATPQGGTLSSDMDRTRGVVIPNTKEILFM